MCSCNVIAQGLVSYLFAHNLGLLLPARDPVTGRGSLGLVEYMMQCDPGMSRVEANTGGPTFSSRTRCPKGDTHGQVWRRRWLELLLFRKQTEERGHGYPGIRNTLDTRDKDGQEESPECTEYRVNKLVFAMTSAQGTERPPTTVS